MEESESAPEATRFQRVLRILGLNEETVSEVGGSHYVHAMIICVLRFFMAVLNIIALLLLYMDVKRGGFRLFWDVPLKSRWVGIEMWTSTLVVVAWFLLGYVSGQALVKRADHRMARVAGPLSFAASTLAIFSVAVNGRMKLSWDRNIIYGFPILAVLSEIVLGSRNSYRLRAVGVPLGIIQLQQTVGTAYLWIYTPKVMNNLRFLGLGIAYNIVGALCALVVVLLSRCNTICASKIPKQEANEMVYMVHD